MANTIKINSFIAHTQYSLCWTDDDNDAKFIYVLLHIAFSHS